MNEKLKKIRNIMTWIYLGFFVPPLAWFLTCYYSGIFQNFNELLEVALRPVLILYIIISVGINAFFIRKKLVKLASFEEKDFLKNSEKINQTIRQVPTLFFWGVVVYCIIGPNVALYGIDFIDKTEYILCEVSIIPLILFYNLPFFILVTQKIEEFTFDFPLGNSLDFFSLQFKLVTASIFNLFGILFLLLTFVFTVYYENKNDLLTLPNVIGEKLLVVTVCSVFFVILNILLVSKQITNPIKQILRQIKIISSSEGNLSERLIIDNRDEIGFISKYLNSAFDKIAKLILNVQEAANELKTNTEVLLEDSNKIHSASTKQAMLLSQTSSIFEEILTQANLVSNQTEKQFNMMTAFQEDKSELDQSIMKTKNISSSITLNSGHAFEQSLKTEVISSETLTGFTEIEASSKQMNSIIKMINDIAYSTNLLALNASIEAARAGEFGKGFVVVSEEIGKLAHKSVAATKDISNLINKSINNVSNGSKLYQQVDSNIKEVKNTLLELQKMGNTLSEESNSQIILNKKIISSMEVVFEFATKISEATISQKKDIGNIVNSISTLNSSTQENLNSLSQMNNYIDHLKNQFGKLNFIIEKFRV